MFARTPLRLGVATAARGLVTAGATSGLAAATEAPASVAAGTSPVAAQPAPTAPGITEDDPLTWSGIGDAELGDTGPELVEQGLAEKHPDCESYLASDAVPEGIHFGFDNTGTLKEITLTEEADNTTQHGARANSTYGELRELHGEDLELTKRDGSGGVPVSIAVVTHADKELAFLGDEELSSAMEFKDDDQFERVVLRDSGAFLGSGC